MDVLVTGATGHLGPFVSQVLRARGHRVRAMVRSTSDSTWLVSHDVEVIEGDVLEPDSLARAVDGVAAVIHMAGLHDSWAERKDQFFGVNVDGAINVRDAAASAGLSRMVFVSSGSTIGECEGSIGNELTGRRDYALSDYERSKVAAEMALLDDATEFDVVIVNPGTVYGPGDASGIGQALVGALTGQLGVSIDAPVAWVYVEDVAHGIASALTQGRPGERYILVGQNVSRLDFLRRAVELADVDYEVRPASALAWQAFALIYGLKGWITRSRPTISRAAVRIALHGSQLDGSKAEKDLGVTYTSLDEGLDATLDWLHDAGLVDLSEEDGDGDSNQIGDPDGGSGEAGDNRRLS